MVVRVRVDLPVVDQHLLPDDLPDDLLADATQLGEFFLEIIQFLDSISWVRCASGNVF